MTGHWPEALRKIINLLADAKWWIFEDKDTKWLDYEYRYIK